MDTARGFYGYGAMGSAWGRLLLIDAGRYVSESILSHFVTITDRYKFVFVLVSAMSDPRFARIKTDPRFRRPKNKQRKVLIDDRFKSLFQDSKKSKGKGKDTRASRSA
jgi:hypothetical protein